MNAGKDKLVYWISTGIVCSVVLFSVVNFTLDHPLGPAPYKAGGAFAHLGLPNWFKVELTVSKILALVALLVPNLPRKIKEFAYFGLAITFISASVAHFGSGDGALFVVDPLIFLGVLAVSYFYFNKLGNMRQRRQDFNAATIS